MSTEQSDVSLCRPDFLPLAPALFPSPVGATIVHMDTYDIFQKLAESLIALDQRIEKIVKPLTDDEIREVVAACRKESQPGGSKNFAMPEWNLVADKIEHELRMRHFFRRAEEHEKATGSKNYCLHCDGDCTPEHIAEMDDD